MIYRTARQALKDLGEDLDDKNHELYGLKVLNDGDIRAPLEEQELTLNAKGSRAHLREGVRKHSWIWDSRRGKSASDKDKENISPGKQTTIQRD
jgi:hypothetical protein